MKIPKYVKMWNGSEMRLIEGSNGQGRYYRDAGDWGVGYEVKDGILLSVSPFGVHDSLDGKELIEITEEEYKNTNRGYLQ